MGAGKRRTRWRGSTFLSGRISGSFTWPAEEPYPFIGVISQILKVGTTMRKSIIIGLFLFYGYYLQAQSLRGHISDSATHHPLEGASVYFPQLKLGGVSDAGGNYEISPLPRGTYEVEIRVLEHAGITKQISIQSDRTLDFATPVSFSSLQQVAVTSLGNVTNLQRSTVPVTLVTHDMMLHGNSNTVIDAIASQPGINETTEGPGTAKPQINGLGFDRVLTLMDGVPQEDFQWGDDHGVLIDPYAVYDAEIIRGPASLQYGASAEAGVISFKSDPFAESGTLQGSLLSEYHTNNGYVGSSLHMGGNNNGLVWNLSASTEEAHAYRNPKDGYVWGTAWRQENARLTTGINRNWGFSRLTCSALHKRIQVPDGNRDSATGHFEFDFAQHGQLYPGRADFLSYDAKIAGDKLLDDYQAWWQNSINVGTGKVGIDAGFTRSVHHDIDTGSIGQGNFYINEIPFSLKYQLEGASSGLKLTAGINGKYDWEKNFPEPPAPYIADYEIPNYHNFEIGTYGLLEKTIARLTLSGGLRLDETNFKGQAMYLANAGTPQQTIVPPNTPGAILQFNAFNNTYSGWSGSLGASYQLPHNNYIKGNISKSFRAPAIKELTSNGLNIGSNAVQLGNIGLKAEQGYQADIVFGNNGRDLGVELDGFYNHISNFIFADRTDSVSQGYPVYEYVSSNTAIITGMSGYVNIHPSGAKWLEIDNGLTYIYSYLPNSTDSTRHLPWIPAPHLMSQLKIKLKDRQSSVLRKTCLEFGLAKYWEQNHIYSALHTELPSAAYVLLNAGIGTNFVHPASGKVICSVYLDCTNLGNVVYADHLNLAQYFLSYNGQLVTVKKQKQGVYNMGRNLGLKVIFPFSTQHKTQRENALGHF